MHIVQTCEREQWNALNEKAQTGYITQTWEWGQLSHLGTMHRLAVANDTGEYLAEILLIETFAPIIHRPYLYAPRGPVCDDPDSSALTMLLDAVGALARRRGCFMLKIEPQVEDGNPIWLQSLKERGFKRNPYANHPRRSWMVDIRVPEKELLGNMKTSWRYNINRGLRKLQIRAGHGPTDRQIFFDIYTETAQRDNFFMHPQSHYDELFDLFETQNKGVLFIAEYEGEPIACQVAMTCGKVTTSMFSASSNRHRNMRPNHPLQWTAIQWAKRQGSEIYDFRAISERLEPDSELYSLYQYKHGYGGYSLLTVETHDLVFQPALYFAYRQALNVKRHREHLNFLRQLKQRHTAGEQGKTESEEA